MMHLIPGQRQIPRFLLPVLWQLPQFLVAHLLQFLVAQVYRRRWRQPKLQL